MPKTSAIAQMAANALLDSAFTITIPFAVPNAALPPEESDDASRKARFGASSLLRIIPSLEAIFSDVSGSALRIAFMRRLTQQRKRRPNDRADPNDPYGNNRPQRTARFSGCGSMRFGEAKPKAQPRRRRSHVRYSCVVRLRPMIPAPIRRMQMIFIALAGSFRNTMPSIAAPTIPMPVHTA